MKKEYKMLTFDVDEKRQALVFNFLEKVRYQQTKFIVSLVEDFCKEYNITDETDYNEIKKAVKEYSSGREVSPLNSSVAPDSITSLNEKVELILQILTNEENAGNRMIPEEEETRAQVEHNDVKPISADSNAPDSDTAPELEMKYQDDEDDYGIDDMLSSFEEAKKG